MIISTSGFLTLLGCHWGNREDHATARNARKPGGTGVRAFNPPESMHSVLGFGWSVVGLHKSLSPLTRQDAQHGAQFSSSTIHTELVWPHEACGDQSSLLILAMGKQTCSGGWELGFVGDFILNVFGHF